MGFGFDLPPIIFPIGAPHCLALGWPGEQAFALRDAFVGRAECQQIPMFDKRLWQFISDRIGYDALRSRQIFRQLESRRFVQASAIDADQAAPIDFRVTPHVGRKGRKKIRSEGMGKVGWNDPTYEPGPECFA